MECLYGFLSNISRDLVCGAVNQLRYPCCFNTFVKELEKEEANLIATRDGVKDCILYGKRQGRNTANVVEKWLEDAEIDVDNVNNLLNEARTKQSCCFGNCPNWIFRCRLGKKLANKKKELEKFIKDGGQYIQLARVGPLPSGILDLSSEKYLSFGSRQKAYEELMEAVKDDEVGMIGLHGMGGCGKTIMAMEVQKKAEAEHLFDKVLFVPVSSTVEVRRIQDKIASSLQYTFPENEERERAKRLNERLSQESKILVILDDVWQILDIYEIGIPSPEHDKGCKVLITTRSEDVCNSMDCRKKIHLPILDDDEAWTLFGKEANIKEHTSDTLRHLARQISDECKGLPVAIAAVASTLKGKPEVIWRDALIKLKSSKRVNIEKGLQDPYKCLELSYHYLDNEEAKSLFLLCSVFPKDYGIPIELLARCAIGLGVVGEVRSYEEARNEVIAAKIKLVSCCLLLDAGSECVKMYDLVRDVAHWIAKNENKGIKCEVENDVTLEQNSVRYLWCKKLPNDLDCSNLEFLCIETEVEVLDEIFTRMGKLRVLCLVNEGGERLPLSTMSFKTLTNLCCLILSGWKLSDISFVRYMKKLESLSLNKCSLPSFLDLQKDDAVTQLTKLKLLVLDGCEMERNIFEVIGRIPQLEELCIVDGSAEWNDYSENTIKFFKSFSVPQTLQRYTIELGGMHTDGDGEFPIPRERTFSLKFFHMSNESLYLMDCPQWTSLFTQAITPIPVPYNIFQNLQQVRVIRCRELKYVFSANTVGGLPQLKMLEVWDCNQLEQTVEDIIPSVAVMNYPLAQHHQRQEPNEIIEENTSSPSAPFVNHSPGSFTLSKLTSLVLVSCPKLGSIFPVSIAKTLTSLEELTITNCDGLKHLLTSERTHKSQKQNSIEDDHDLRSVISMFLSLKRLDICRCDSLQHIFPVCFVGGQKDFEDNSCHLQQKNIQSGRQVSLVLEKLELIDLPQMNSIWVASKNYFTLQHLKTLEITTCAKLEVIFPVPVVRCLPELERLEIRECKELKKIMEEDENDTIQRELKQCFPKLTVMIVEQCHKLKHLFSMSASNSLLNLEVLIINGADELEELGNAKVELPKLKLLILMHLPNLCQGIELLAVKHCIINNCPKLSLTSTTTLQELSANIRDSDFKNIGLSRWDKKEGIGMVFNNSIEVPPGEIGVVSNDHIVARINEEPEKEFVAKISTSEIPTIATSLKNSELVESSLPSYLDIPLHKTHSNFVQGLVNRQSMSEPCLMNQKKPLGEFISSPEISQNIKSDAEEGTISDNTNMAALSMHLESATSQAGQLVTSQSKSYQHAPSKKVTTITQKSLIPPTSKSVSLAPITTKVAEPSKPVDKGKKKMVDQPETAPKPVGEKLMSSAINSAPREFPASSFTPPSSDSSDQKSASRTVRAIPAPKKVGESSRPTTLKELEIHQVSSTAVGGDNQEPLVEISHDSTAEVTSLPKSPTNPVSANVDILTIASDQNLKVEVRRPQPNY